MKLKANCLTISNLFFHIDSTLRIKPPCNAALSVGESKKELSGGFSDKIYNESQKNPGFFPKK